jgi:hypothetical protein
MQLHREKKDEERGYGEESVIDTMVGELKVETLPMTTKKHVFFQH